VVTPRAPGLAAAALALAACGTFEDPAIVIDLRALAVTAEPPEQVVPIDPDNPFDITFAPFEISALVADPFHRTLAWRLMACPPQPDLRCTDLTAPFIVVDQFVVENTDVVGQIARATVPGGPALTAIVRETIERDSLQGFGGVDINVSIRAAPVGAPESEAVYAGKAVRFSAQIPAERVANRNPDIAEILVQVDRGDGLGFGEAQRLESGACRDRLFALEVPSGGQVKLAPRPVDGSNETYVVPTFEGGTRVFTENLRYQWLATAGSWSRDETGGPRDLAGNPASISTEWRSPRLFDDESFRLVDMWVVQRDERGGNSVTQACFVAVP
jgi:hypothetical protein